MAAHEARRRAVLLVGPTSPPVHGMTVFTEMLLRSSLMERFRIHHLDTADRRNVGQMGRPDLVNVCLGLKHAVQMAWMILRHRPCLVYLPIAQNFWGYFRDAVLMIIAMRFGCRVVVHLHGGYFGTFYEGTSLFMRRLIRLTMGRASSVIVLGESLRDIIPAFPRSCRIAVVPNGIPDVWQREDMPLSKHKDGPFTVAFLSSLYLTKGVCDLARAASHIKRAGHSHIRFRFAGAWSRRDEAEQCFSEIVREAKLDNSVELVGVVRGEAKRRFLAEADCFVLPTYYPLEGQPQAILEAMAAGLPVVATDQGAIRETVVDGVTGILTEKQKPERLARDILRLAENAELRHHMSAAGRARFEQEYTAERCVERLIAVFEKVLADMR